MRRGNPVGSKRAQAENASTPPGDKLPCKRRLKTAEDLRLFLADTMNRANRSEVDQALARCLGYLAQVLGGLIQTSDLEARLSALEAQLKESGGERPRLYKRL